MPALKGKRLPLCARLSRKKHFNCPRDSLGKGAPARPARHRGVAPWPRTPNPKSFGPLAFSGRQRTPRRGRIAQREASVILNGRGYPNRDAPCTRLCRARGFLGSPNKAHREPPGPTVPLGSPTRLGPSAAGHELWSRYFVMP